MKTNHVKKQIYQTAPPEGGWGILVCIGMALPFISALGSMPTFGLLYFDFLKDLGEGTSAIAVITSAFFSAMSFAGLFTNSLFKRYSIRTVALTGGILYFMGAFLQIFVQSTFQLLIAFSIMQGAAFGLIVPSSYTTFNNYFINKRVMMMSFAQTLIGLGTMFYPIIVRKLLEIYGFRGCLAVLAGINAHAIFGMLIMHPVEWHMRRIPIVEHEMKEFSSVENVMNLKSKHNSQHLEPLMSKPTSLRSLDSKPNSLRSLHCSRHDIQRNSLGRIRVLRDNNLSRRASSIASLGNWTGAVVVSDASEMVSKPCKNWRDSAKQAFVDFLDLTLLKQPIYVNIVLGISFALYSDVAFFTLQPMYLFELGYTISDTATVIAIGAAADLGSRVFLALTSAFVTVPSRYVYLAGALFTVVARFAFLSVFDFMSMSIITAILGFLRTWVHVPLPLVFAEYLPKERFPSGYGLFMFLQGNIMFIVGPVVGYVRDATKSYNITFHCLNFFMAACAIPWLIEIIYLKCRGKSESNKQLTNQTESNNAVA